MFEGIYPYYSKDEECRKLKAENQLLKEELEELETAKSFDILNFILQIFCLVMAIIALVSNGELEEIMKILTVVFLALHVIMSASNLLGNKTYKFKY